MHDRVKYILKSGQININLMRGESPIGNELEAERLK